MRILFTPKVLDYLQKNIGELSGDQKARFVSFLAEFRDHPMKLLVGDHQSGTLPLMNGSSTERPLGDGRRVLFGCDIAEDKDSGEIEITVRTASLAVVF